MQNFSAINFTICGGRTLFREVNPILESSSRYGSHHRMSVVTDTPALAQIDQNSYAIPYQTDGRKVVKVGVKFNRDTRVPEEWVIEE